MVQYCRVRVAFPDNDIWRILVLDLTACSGVRSLGMVERVLSAIVTAGAS